MATPAPAITTIADAIECLYDLSVGTIGVGTERHERPHKPVLLLAVLDLIATGNATPANIKWSEGLRQRFDLYFAKVRQFNDSSTPENPFLYLRSDGIWQPFSVDSQGTHPLDHTPTVAEARSGDVYARISGGLEAFFANPIQRQRLREALLSRYFPNARDQISPLFQEPRGNTPPGGLTVPEPAADEKTKQGRNPAFRRKVLEVYDWQCAACGLRIKLPDHQMTFVDGAHLIPFGISRNDHPSNGIALCKNHHWAMDRFLIVPTPENRWKTSPLLDRRRSTGENELCALDGQPLLPPHDDAFRPAIEGISWRIERLFRG